MFCARFCVSVHRLMQTPSAHPGSGVGVIVSMTVIVVVVMVVAVRDPTVVFRAIAALDVVFTESLKHTYE